MLKSYAMKITSFLVDIKDVNKKDYEVYKYGFNLSILFIISTVIVFIVGILFDKLFYSIVFLICYCSIRHFVGGYHDNSYIKYLLIFIFIFILTIYTSANVDSQIYTLMIFIISTLSCVGIFILAPLEYRNNPLTLSEIKKYKKVSKILSGIVYILTLIFLNIESLNELSAYTCSSLFWVNIMLCLGIIFKNLLCI